MVVLTIWVTGGKRLIMIRIDIKGNKAYLIGNISEDMLRLLDLELSFRITGYEYSMKFMSGAWDGRTRLLYGDLTFNVGLVPRVVDFFKDHEIDVQVCDHNKYKDGNPIDIYGRLKEVGKEPRAHQTKALEAALEYKRGIIRVATGGGKTLIAALIVGTVGKDAIIYVIGKELLWQFHNFFTQVFEQEIGVIGDGIVKICPITIASVWTVGQAFGMKTRKDDEEAVSDEKTVAAQFYEKIRQHVANVGVSILDECHLGAAETIQRIGTAIRSQYTIGMSASPYRDDNADMLIEALFGKVIINISASELISQGFLVKPIIRFITVPKMDDMPKHYKQIYNYYISESKTRNDLIIRAAKSLVQQGFITMILFKEIEHGKRLYREIQKDIHCHMLNGTMDTDKRKLAIDEINEGKCKLVLASSIFDIGVDIPSLSGLVLAGGGKSSIRVLQRIGRVIRSHPGKDMAAIIDFLDNAKYLKDHSKRRREIYQQESGFEVQWPKLKRK